jgi:hypothetical protein
MDGGFKNLNNSNEEEEGKRKSQLCFLYGGGGVPTAQSILVQLPKTTTTTTESVVGLCNLGNKNVRHLSLSLGLSAGIRHCVIIKYFVRPLFFYTDAPCVCVSVYRFQVI